MVKTENWDSYTFPSANIAFFIAKGETRTTAIVNCQKDNPVHNPIGTQQYGYKYQEYKKSFISNNPKDKGRKLKIPFDIAASYAIMQSMVGSSEIGGLGIMEIDGDSVILKKMYACYDARDGAGVHFSNEAELGRVIVKARMEGHPGTSIKIFWHSHPNFGTSPSITDIEAIDKIITNNPKAEVYSVIFSNMREISCRYDSKVSGTYECEQMTVEVVPPTDNKATVVIDDVNELIEGTKPYGQKKVYTYTGYQQGNFYRWDDEFDFAADARSEKKEEKKPEDIKSLPAPKNQDVPIRLISRVNLTLESYDGFFQSNPNLVLESYTKLVSMGDIASEAFLMIDEAMGGSFVKDRIFKVLTALDTAINTDKELTYEGGEFLLKSLREIEEKVNKLNFVFTGDEHIMIDNLDKYIHELARLTSLISEPAFIGEP